jgi:hypothetical protein
VELASPKSPPPDITWNFTGALAQGFPFESLMETTSGMESNCPGAAVWLFPLTALSVGKTPL